MSALLAAWLLPSVVFSNAPPSCAPSRSAHLTARRPEWLAQAFDAAHIPATTVPPPAPWWHFFRAPAPTPTFTFEATRRAGQFATFAVLAALGLYGAVQMPSKTARCLAAAMAVAAMGTFGTIHLILAVPHGWFDAFGALALVVLVLAAGMAVGCMLAAVPVVWGCAAALSLLAAQRRAASTGTMEVKPRGSILRGDHSQQPDDADTDTDGSDSVSECDEIMDEMLYGERVETHMYMHMHMHK